MKRFIGILIKFPYFIETQMLNFLRNLFSRDTHTVKITQKHCLGAEYTDNYNCPLAKAIKEQLPTFPLDRVGGGFLLDRKGNSWDFDHYIWNAICMEEIAYGDKDSVKVTFKKRRI